MRNSEYFQSLEPINVAEELAHYGVSAATLAECVASCGCCVSVDAWSKVGDRDAWFEVWWLWLIHNATIKELAGLSTNKSEDWDGTYTVSVQASTAHHGPRRRSWDFGT